MRATSTGAKQSFLPGFDLFAALLATEGQPSTSIATLGSDATAAPLNDIPQGCLTGFENEAGLQPADGSDVVVEDPVVAVTNPSEPDVAATEAETTDPLFQPTALIQPYGRVDAIERDRAPWPLLATNALVDTLTGPVAKFDANIAAIELLRELEASNRWPTTAERLTLQRYTGWGGLKEVFEPRPLPEWVGRKTRLEALLAADELVAARSSVVNAHYTDLPIVEAMWAGLQRLGFAGGRILEPALGVGHFLGMMPSDLAQASQMHATELDTLSGRIATKLYGNGASINIAGFETVEYPEAWFDLVVSNVPFGNYTVPCHRHKPYSKKSIHNYFLGRAIDLVRPGGIVAIITSTFFMDGKAEAFRRYVSTRARLLGAIRLPRRAFAKIASTDVSTDILFLQRRRVGEVPAGTEDAWLNCHPLPVGTYPQTSSGVDSTKNIYWAQRPEMIVGEWAHVRGQYSRSGGGELIADYSGNDFVGDLRKRIDSLPTGVYAPLADAPQGAADGGAVKTATVRQREGEFVLRNGQLLQRSEGQLRPSGLTGKALLRAHGMHVLRNQTRALLSAQMDPAQTEEQLCDLRRELNQTYDAFVAVHGWVSSRGNARVFRSDPDWPLMLSLEIYDEEHDSAEKAAIFTKRTGHPSFAPTKAESTEDALAISMSEAGEVNPAYMGQLLGLESAPVMAELLDTGLVFINPATGRYEAASEYLSGHIRQKIEVAKQGGDRYDSNVRALEQALPADLKPHEIDARIGASWVPTSDYEAFVIHLAATEWTRYNSVTVDRDITSGAWSITGHCMDFTVMKTTWGTKDVDGIQIIVRALNGQAITVRDPVDDGHGGVRYVVNVTKTAAARERQAAIEEQFKSWLWSDSTRADRLLRYYNDTYNSFVERKFDGSRLRLPGYSWVLAPSAHQLNGAARIASGNNTLLAHVVGAGKTLTMAIGSMELRRLGLARKPCHVVPNHMLLQYTAEFIRAYPAANLLMATKDDLAKDRRKAFMARAATGDWDAIIMTHSSFEKLATDPTITRSLIEEWLSEVKAALAARQKSKEERSIVKQLVKMEKEWAARLERMEAQWKKDDFLTLTMLGIDHLFVDEAHLAKNLFRFSQMERVAGLPNNSSQRAFDMLVKTQQIMALHQGKERGVVMATGTPVANSMAELHVMQRFLQPQTLRRLGLEQFDSWAAQFGRVVNALEVSPDGASFRMNARFAQFVNLPELMGMFGQVADIQTKQMLNLPTPALLGGGPQVTSVKPSERLKAYIATLVERAEAIRAGSVGPEVDNMLAVTNDGRKAALDIRLVLPGEKADPDAKVAACVNKVHELWIKTMDFRGTQLIFSDLGTPGNGRFSVYEEIRDHLVLKGVPSAEIAFIHDYQTDRAKEQLFGKVREGHVRVLLGSTQKMGMGTNVQQRLYALHHLDAPWRPADVEQREGRIERRGNDCEAVEIWRYVTEGSFDAYLWQGLAAKARFIAQVMSGDRAMRRIEDAELSALSYEEVKAIACGNPVVKEKALLDAEYRKLCMLKDHFRDTQWVARNELKWLPEKLTSAERDLEAARSDLATVTEHDCEDVVVAGTRLTDCVEIDKALGVIGARERETMHLPGDDAELCVYGGLPLRVQTTLFKQEWGNYKFVLGVKLKQEIKPYRDGKRLHQELARAIGHLNSYIVMKRAQIQQMLAQQPLLQAQASTPFEHEQRLQEVSRRLRELDIELGLVKDIDGSAAMDSTGTVENHTSMTAADAGSACEQDDLEEAAA